MRRRRRPLRVNTPADLHRLSAGDAYDAVAAEWQRAIAELDALAEAARRWTPGVPTDERGA